MPYICNIDDTTMIDKTDAEKNLYRYRVTELENIRDPETDFVCDKKKMKKLS